MTANLHPFYFDVSKIGDPSEEYVAWADVMGIQQALRRSTPVAANFVYKTHIAALSSRPEGLRLYPVMDGLYASTQDSESMKIFLRAFFRSLADEFIKQQKPHFRFVVRAAVAKGLVYHGSNLDGDASWVLRDNPSHRNQILLGLPVVQAHLGEGDAPPFGIFVDSTAEAFSSGEAFPFDVWWRWYDESDVPMVGKLRAALGGYYNWCTSNADNIGYSKSRIRIHRGQASQYVRQ